MKTNEKMNTKTVSELKNEKAEKKATFSTIFYTCMIDAMMVFVVFFILSLLEYIHLEEARIILGVVLVIKIIVALVSITRGIILDEKYKKEIKLAKERRMTIREKDEVLDVRDLAEVLAEHGIEM